MPSKSAKKGKQRDTEIEDLRARLAEAEEVLRALRAANLDALVVSDAGGERLLPVEGAAHPYRLLIEDMNEGALTLTAEGLVLYANRRFAEMIGTPLENVIGSEMYTWIAPESRPVFQALLQTDADSNRRAELALAAAGGTQVPVLLSMSRLHLDAMPDSFCLVATDLTEQKRNEAIVAAEKLARTILKQAAEAIVVTDATGRIIRASKMAHAFYGENPIGRPFEHVFPLRQPDGATLPLTSIADTNDRRSLEARMERNGQVSDLLVSVGPLTGEGEERLGGVVTLTDITKRKQAEEALRASERTMRELVSILPAAVYVCGVSGVIESYNRRAVELWGREPRCGDNSELFCGAYRIYRPDGARLPHTDCPMAQALRTGKPVVNETIVIERPDGSRRMTIVNAITRLDEHDRMTGAISCLTDITEIDQKTRKLREMEQHFRVMIEGIRDYAIFTLDPGGLITSWNSGAQRIEGYAANEILGKHIRVFYPPADAAAGLPEHYLQSALRTGSAEYEGWRVRKDGTQYWADVVTTAVHGEHREVRGFVKITRDVTERKEAQEQLRHSARELRALAMRLVDIQENERKTLSRELHDRVGQTLTALNINLDLLRSQIAVQGQEKLSAIVSDSTKLVRETMDCVEDVMKALRPAALDDYGLMPALRWHAEQFEARTGIVTEVSGPMDSVRLAGPVEIAFFRIAQEALNNIAKHAQASHASLTLVVRPDTVELTVTDNGIGINNADPQESVRRTGWGMATMRERSTALGGVLEFKSNAGQGCSVIARLPRIS